MSINIIQHKTHRKIHLQDKAAKQNKTKRTHSQEQTNVLLQVVIHNGIITCIRLILMTFEIFQSSSYSQHIINIQAFTTMIVRHKSSFVLYILSLSILHSKNSLTNKRNE